MDCFSACSVFSNTALNPYDKKWQKSKSYKPDKELQWDERPFHRDEWYMSHSALRSEVKELLAALSAVVERSELHLWEASALQRAWEMHKEHVLANIQSKNEVVSPFLSERINLDAKIKEARTQAQKALDAMDQRFADLDPAVSTRPILKAFEKYQVVLLQYLSQEQSSELLLMRVFFSPNEVKPMVAELLNSTPAAGMGSLIFYAGDETFSEFMKQEEISSFSWYWDLRSKRNQFEDQFAAPLAAVISGVPQNSCVLCLLTKGPKSSVL